MNIESGETELKEKALSENYTESESIELSDEELNEVSGGAQPGLSQRKHA